MRYDLVKKIDASRRFLEMRLKGDDPRLQFANSGGKDSLVVFSLLNDVTDKLPRTVYANTTIDPPGTIAYIKRVMPETEIVHPQRSFYDLVKARGLPTRLARFCCAELKEHHSVGKISIEGVRAAESRKRSSYEPEMCDTRKSQKGAVHSYPIFTWSNADVWDFINARGLEVAPCYAKGMERLGCVGCPMGGTRKRRLEFSLYPGVYTRIREMIRQGMALHPQWKLSQVCRFDADVAMDWWMSRETMEMYKQALNSSGYYGVRNSSSK